MACNVNKAPVEPFICTNSPATLSVERVAEAKRQYENTLAMLANGGLDDVELNAAGDRAKQQYLRELDDVMK